MFFLVGDKHLHTYDIQLLTAPAVRIFNETFAVTELVRHFLLYRTHVYNSTPPILMNPVCPETILHYFFSSYFLRLHFHNEIFSARKVSIRCHRSHIFVHIKLCVLPLRVPICFQQIRIMIARRLFF